MNENYLMLNGKRIELTEEQVKTLRAEENKSPFERAKKKGKYFFIKASGTITEMREDNIPEDDNFFSIANYCTDKAMMQQRALHETLNRLLWRYSEEHGGDNGWGVGACNYFINCYKNSDNFYVGWNMNNHILGIVYFKDKETAQSAIEEIVKPFMEQHPEFVW